MGTRLKQQRIRAELEIKEAAHRVGKTYQYVRQIEEGINDPPTWALLASFARAYGTSVDYLLGLTDDSRPPASNTSLPEGAPQLLEYLGEMSERGRAELLTIAEAIYSMDKELQDAATASNFVAAMGGPELLERFGREVALRAKRLGSVDAALSEFRADLLGTFTSEQFTEDEEQ